MTICIYILVNSCVCCLTMCKEFESKINYGSDILASFRGHSVIPAVYKRQREFFLWGSGAGNSSRSTLTKAGQSIFFKFLRT